MLGGGLLLGGGDLAGEHLAPGQVGAAEGLDGGAQGGLVVVGEPAGGADGVEDRGAAPQVVQQGALEGQDVGDVEIVEVAVSLFEGHCVPS